MYHRLAPRRSPAVFLACTALVLGACGEDPPAPPPQGATAVDIDAEGSSLAAVEMGSGTRGAVLVHGASTRKELWYPLMPELAAGGFHVVAYDARGVGESEGEGEDHAGDLEAVIEHLRESGVEDIVLMGSSRGGRTVLAEASEADYAGVVTFSSAGPDDYDIDEPGLYIAAEDDSDRGDAARALADAFDGEAMVVDGDVHGADLLRDDRRMVEAVVAFAGDAVHLAP